MRERRHEAENYTAFFHDGKTLRFAIDSAKPILPLRYPEIEDVSLGTKCLAACKFCYTSAIKEGENYPDVVGKVIDYYGGLSMNERPFQVALGGGGEPTLHPDFPEVLRTFSELGIMPNYTTNAMHLTDEVVEATVKYAGGVAVSCHPHLEKVWRRGVETLVENGVKTCVHVIVGEPGSADNFWRIYNSTKGIHYYVVLPYIVAGRAKDVNAEAEWDKFFQQALEVKPQDVSFGALFYDYFMRNRKTMADLSVSVYEPEVLSGYRMMDDSYKLLRKSSYDLTPKFGAKALVMI